MPPCLIVARKEMRDHLRDTRSLMSTMVYSLMGPVVVMLVSISRPSGQASKPTLLLSMASVFALVSAFAGGMNVAMDSMAGERERRSLVPLLVTPVSRMDLVLGKWIAASVLGIGALSLTVIAFALVLLWGASESLRPIGSELTAWVLLGLVPMVLLGAALHLFVSAKSHTIKEAHSWLSIMVFLPMLVGMFLVFFPGQIGRWWFAVPIVGQQSLLSRTLEGQGVSMLQGAVLAVLTVAAAVPALMATRGVLNRDDVATG